MAPAPGLSTVDLSRFLLALRRRGIELRVIPAGQLQLRGDASPQVREQLGSRQAEIVAHLQASPGRGIAGYPEELKFHTLAFQQSLVDEQRRLGWILERPGHPPRWLEGPSAERMREIAHELDEILLLAEVFALREDPASKQPRPPGRVAAIANANDLPCPLGGSWTAAKVEEVFGLAGAVRKGRTLFHAAARAMDGILVRQAVAPQRPMRQALSIAGRPQGDQVRA